MNDENNELGNPLLNKNSTISPRKIDNLNANENTVGGIIII